MGKKRASSIGKDVLKKAMPSKAELTLNFPFNIVQLKMQWEKDAKRPLSEEEFQQRLRKFLKTQAKPQKRQRGHRVPPEVDYI